MLTKMIEKMKKKRGSEYKPRTRHILEDGSAKYTNRLFLESSPYLIQHAHNPVDWHPWGDEAFETAKKNNKPLFVSIGYSTCHWCHVMEEESFEDEEIAEFLNANFIPVKVDREEMPDVDSVYMSAVQLLTGHGGWPLNVWLTPSKLPFYGGTYFPARDGDRAPAAGFLSILKQLNNVYTSNHDAVLDSGKNIVKYMGNMLEYTPGDEIPEKNIFGKITSDIEKIYDFENGGTKSFPKFPSTLNIRLLLRLWKQTGRKDILKMASDTLTKMSYGGIYDHVGGGFHRYSTDAKWLVPHFEKMLYDNALLCVAYLEGWQATGNKRFAEISDEILKYVLREMTGEKGGFYSAGDADTLTPKGEKEEGYYFTWTKSELSAVLSEEDMKIIQEYYSLGESPNFEGRYILNISKNISATAGKLGLDSEALNNDILRIKGKLFNERTKRIPPFIDTKILTSWNSLMISAFAKCGLSFGNDNYIEVAEKASEFILSELFDGENLYRIYKDGVAKHKAYLDDYAFFEAALIDLHEATGKKEFLSHAIFMDAKIRTLFEDKMNGGFFMTSKEHYELPAREKPAYDGAIPSGNSVAVLNLLRLYSLTSEEQYMECAEKSLKASSKIISENPIAMAEMVIALDFYYGNRRNKV